MSKQYSYKQLIRLLSASTLIGMCSPVWAAAFQIMEQGASGLGSAYAGSAALAEDASTGFYNSAGLSRLRQEQIAVSAVAIVSQAKLAPTRILSSMGTPTTLDVAKAKGNSVVPGLHYAAPISNDWTFGLNVVSPFGLNTKYSTDGSARYAATRSELTTYDIAPSLAYSFGNGLSIGAGPDFIYTQAKLDTQLGIGNPSTDGHREDSANRWALAGHIGALYEPSESTRIGINYRSGVKVKAKGESVQLIPTAFGGTGVESRQNIRSSVQLPETVVVSIVQKLDDVWTAMLDVQWTHWKKFKDLAITRSDGQMVRIIHNFKNTYRAAVGLSYQFDDSWKFRTGVAHDRSPVRDQYRTARIPDSHRNWVSAGFQYRILKSLALDVGYSHLFFKRASISEQAPTVTGSLQPRQEITGRYRNRADLIGLQLTWDIG